MHVVFDLDGVLLDSETNLSWLDRGLSSALDALELPTTIDYQKRLYPATRAAFESLASDIGRDPEVLWEIRDNHYTQAKIRAIETGEITPFPDITALESIPAGDHCHIISNSPQAVVESFLDTASMGQKFEVTLGRGTRLADLDRLKPAPYLFNQLTQQTDAPEPYVYIGDRATDRQFANAVGIDFVHLTRDEEGMTSLTALPARLDAWR